MSQALATAPDPSLIIHFQGLCCFLRNAKRLEDTTEVTTVLVAGERAPEEPRLCVHTPVLVFRVEDFVRTDGKASHVSALLPGPGNDKLLPALGVWPLAGRDLRIGGAPREALSVEPGSFGKTADLDQLTGHGAASGACLDPEPPPDRLVAARVFLTSGHLFTTVVVGDNRPDDRWVFDVEDAQPQSGTPVLFSQELRYEFFAAPPASTVSIEAHPFGSPRETETLVLAPGARVAISILCPTDRQGGSVERDFLAYYPLLVTPPRQRLVPHRLPLKNGLDFAKPTLSACPPATTHLEVRR